MATEGRIRRLEGAYEQVNERLGDYIEHFSEISQRLQTLHQGMQGLREEMNANNASLREENNANIAGLRQEMNAQRSEMNANNASLREEMNALRSEMHTNSASIRRESRWIGGVIIAGIIVTVLSIVITRL